jgi:dihydrofolate reductase
MAVKMNTMPKHVATRTLTTLDWENSHVLGDDLAGAVNDLTATSTAPVLVAGSCQLVHALLRADLVDELRLMVFPVAIGGGLRVFPDDRGDLLRYSLADVRTFKSGVVQTTYRRS